MVLHVRTALLEVKKGALTALGEMAAHTGTSFCPFIEPSMQVLQKASTEWHPDVRREAAIAFPSLVVPSIAAYHNGQVQWKRGDTAGTHSTALSQHTLAIVSAVLQEETNLLKDDEKATVSKACEAIQSVIELCGPATLASPTLVEALFSATHDLLTKTAPCYTSELYDEEDDDVAGPGFGGAGSGAVNGDDEDHDAVTQAACDLVGAMCRVLGSHFAPYLTQFLPAILDYAKSSRPPSDRSMAVGCLSEIATELEGAIFEFWSSMFLPCLLAALADTDDNVKRNAAFCTGICAEHLGERIASDYPNLLAQLGPIFSLSTTADNNASENDTNTAACVDNAAAAVARMIMACPNHVPMAQVLPVFLQALPLKMDDTENETVYNCLLGLLSVQHTALLSQMGHVQRIVSQACQDDSTVDVEIQTKLRAAAQSLSQTPPQ
jgi:importin-4